MPDDLTITDAFIKATLAKVTGVAEGVRTPIEAFSALVQKSLVVHVVVAPQVSMRDLLAQVRERISDAVLLDDGNILIGGRTAGLWIPFLFWHEETGADINAIAVLPVVGEGGVDLAFIENMDYLRDALVPVGPPLYYMSAGPAFDSDGNTPIGFTVSPDMVGHALIAMAFVPRDGLSAA